LTDGLMLIRYLFGISYINENIIAEDATRTTSEEITPFIKQLIPEEGYVVESINQLME